MTATMSAAERTSSMKVWGKSAIRCSRFALRGPRFAHVTTLLVVRTWEPHICLLDDEPTSSLLDRCAGNLLRDRRCSKNQILLGVEVAGSRHRVVPRAEDRRSRDRCRRLAAGF